MTGSGKDAVNLYREWWEVARRIRSDADRGRYLMTILDYAFDGVEPEDEQLDVLTLQARMYIDRQRAAYADLQSRRQAAGRLGGLQTQANASKRKQTQASACDDKQTQAKSSPIQYNTTQVYKEKDSANALSKKKAQQAAPGASGEDSTVKPQKSSLHAENQIEKEKGCAEKEKEPDVLPVEVVTVRPRTTPARDAPRFVPPTVAEVAEYCRQRQNGIDAEEFVAAYQQSGWRLKGGAAMKDWRAAVINWEKYRKRHAIHGNTSNYDNDKSVRDAEFARYWAGRVGNKPV